MVRRPPLSAVPATPLDDTHVSARRLFEQLDDRPFATPEGTARLKVYSVFEQGDRRWVQLRIEGFSERMLTVSIARSEGVKDVLRLVSSTFAATSTQFSSVA